jgi:ligand-binding sensor protein
MNTLQYCKYKIDILNLFENKIRKTMENCIICDSNPKYYVNYKCNETHIICLDCAKKDSKCYYKCNNGCVDFTNLYVNIDIDFFK